MKQLAPTEIAEIAPKRLTKRQRKFMDLWLGDPNSDTYGNTYQSALAAGFSETTARVLTTNARGAQWVQEGKKLYSALEPEHIYLAMQKIALTSAYDRDRLKALEQMAKLRGLYIDRSQSEVTVKFTNSVPRPVIDIHQSAEPQEATD